MFAIRTQIRMSSKNAAIQLGTDLNIAPNGNRFGVVLFSSTVKSTIPLSDDVHYLRSHISSIRKPGGGTSIHLGIESMMQMLLSQGNQDDNKVGIVITDGRSDERLTTEAAARAKHAGITMFSVGVGSNLNLNELNSIASFSSNVLHLVNFDVLKQRFKELAHKICLGTFHLFEFICGLCTFVKT